MVVPLSKKRVGASAPLPCPGLGSAGCCSAAPLCQPQAAGRDSPGGGLRLAPTAPKSQQRLKSSPFNSPAFQRETQPAWQCCGSSDGRNGVSPRSLYVALEQRGQLAGGSGWLAPSTGVAGLLLRPGSHPERPSPGPAEAPAESGGGPRW